MAFDGIAVSALVAEIGEKLTGGRIDKITQPEKDEIVLAVRSQGANHKLLLTANATFPRIHLTAKHKESPAVAPMFCMLLRKHIGSGRIVKITQPGLERVVSIHIEGRNEMGDLEEKQLILEIMGRHSNIILVSKGVVLDAAKHVSASLSAVRQILPGRDFTEAPSQDKHDPLNTNEAEFHGVLGETTVAKAIFHNYTGVSSFSAGVICQMAEIDPNIQANQLDHRQKTALFEAFKQAINGGFAPYILYNNTKNPQGFAFFGGSVFGDEFTQEFQSPSELVEYFYSSKDTADRIRQRSQDMRRVVQNLIDRCVKKADIQAKTTAEIADRDTLRLYGELVTANIYAIKQGQPMVLVQNFYEEDLPTIEIELNPQKTPAENAQAYFKKYNKQKRTAEALVTQVAQNEEELAYLEAVMQSIAQSDTVADLMQIREELQEEGFIKKPKNKGKKRDAAQTKPLHFVTPDGFDIFVGKNNQQNDQLTKNADKDDIWLHTKHIPGSHVILKAKAGQISDIALEEAVNLAGFYSKGRGGSMVPVDYCPRKNVRKPAKAKPGMVIYDNYKTAHITPDEERVKALSLKV
ncbi:MAG: NFACT family protein [Defluviitaleaceae bacterium]|nr:NFACT family protein [Defluviitaleaceae bacterium]